MMAMMVEAARLPAIARLSKDMGITLEPRWMDKARRSRCIRALADAARVAKGIGLVMQNIVTN